MFSCSECDYTTPRKSNFNRHLKRHNDIPAAEILPPKIARREPILNIIEPTENDQFLSDIEQQELTDMLNTQAGLGLSQMPSTPPSSPPPANNNDPRQQEFERFFQTEQPWEGDAQLRDVHFRNFNMIRDSDQVHRRTCTYNRYLNGEETTLNEAMEHVIEQVYRHQNHSFKINSSFSAIFQNRETQEYKFYYASNNTKYKAVGQTQTRSKPGRSQQSSQFSLC